MAWIPLAGAAIGALGSFFGAKSQADAQRDVQQQNNMFNADQAVINREWSAEQAAKQMEFQERMSGSQWQRGVSDMQKAGLNPMLAYSQGGASAPSGAMGASSAASAAPMPHMPNPMGEAVSGALSGARTVSDLMTAEQHRSIKDPMERLANVASRWIDEFSKFVSHLGQENRVVVGKISDMVEKLDIRELPAEIARNVAGALEHGMRRAREAVMESGPAAGVSAVKEKAARVREVLSDVEAQVSEVIHGKRGVSVPPSKGKMGGAASRRGDTSGFYKWDMR